MRVLIQIERIIEPLVVTVYRDQDAWKTFIQDNKYTEALEVADRSLPEAMQMVGKLGKKLGPKGLMPNTKLGTVSADVEKAVVSALSGQVQFKLDKAGIIHCSIGTVEFSDDALQENLIALLSEIKKNKPAAAKGQFLRKLYLSTTMGKGSYLVDLSKLTN